MGSFNEVARTIKRSSRQDADRVRGVKVATEAMRALVGQALSLEAHYHTEMQHADAYMANGENKLYAMAVIRAKTLHQERCAKLKEFANYARIAMLDVMGEISADDMTAASGLDLRDRLLIAHVSGKSYGW